MTSLTRLASPATTSALLALLLGAAAPARAADATAEAGKPPGPGALEVALEAGGHFPQVTNKLGTSFDAILKVGYGVALDHRLQLFVDLGYSQPTHDTLATDPRLGAAGTDYHSTLTVKTLSTSLGLAYFFPTGSRLLLPFASAGVHFEFLKSVVEGSSGGQSFGTNTETSTQVGGLACVGLGVRLGPGLLLGEARFTYAPVSQKVTGSANVGALSALLGYGLMF